MSKQTNHTNKDTLPHISRPANRALADRNISSLTALAKFTEPEIAALHGMGPKGIRLLREALSACGLAFRDA